MTAMFEYTLEPLREGADFSFYRGTERRNQMPILAVATASEQPSSQSHRRIEYECLLRYTNNPLAQNIGQSN